MIKYNIVSKRISNDPYGIEKATYKQLEKELISRIDSKLSIYKNELLAYVVNVEIDMNSNTIARINSPSLPNDLLERVRQSLNELGK